MFPQPSRPSADIIASRTVFHFEAILPHGSLSSGFSTLRAWGRGTSSSFSTRPGAAGTHAWWEHGLHPAPSPPPREGCQPLLYAHPLPGTATGQERSMAAELWIPCSPLPTTAEPPLVSRGRREGQHRLSMNPRAGKRHSLVIHNPVLFWTHDLASPQCS